MTGRPRRALAALVLLAVFIPSIASEAKKAELRRGTEAGRGYRLFVPSSPPTGLVVALHGCWQTPEDFAAGTRLNEAGERRALAVVYPVQTVRDNPNRCWNWFLSEHQSRTSGELAEILAIAGAVRREYNVPVDRVVAIGFSAGAFMTVNLACVAPDAVVGIGVASGGPYRCGTGVVGGLQCMRGHAVDANASAAACRAGLNGRRPPRASLWHGEHDPVVDPRNLDALAAMFGALSGASPKPRERRDAATRTVWTDGQGREAEEAWLVDGMPHAWSGGTARATHTYPPGPDATDAMLTFLLK
jgi:poly(hydroxyalkanoate) depolymerase family esterase